MDHFRGANCNNLDAMLFRYESECKTRWEINNSYEQFALIIQYAKQISIKNGLCLF